jgi:DNA polymerase III delta prime subunit
MKWSEKYSPTKIEDYVFSSPKDKADVEHWVKTQNMPDCLLFGQPGTGKTTFGYLLPRLLGASSYDILSINASADFTKTYATTTLENFMQSSGFSNQRFVVIDEADELTSSQQKILMGVMSKYGPLGVRFIIMVNDIRKLFNKAKQSPIQSRCAGGCFDTDTPDKDDFLDRLCYILDSEKIKYDSTAVELFMYKHYPRLRDTIDLLEQHCHTGEFKPC